MASASSPSGLCAAPGGIPQQRLHQRVGVIADTRRGRRPLTCYHEAGHLLARWYFGHFADRAVVLTVEEVKAGAWPIDRRGRASECEGIVEGYDIGPNPYLPQPQFSDEMSQSSRDKYEAMAAMGTDVGLIQCAIGIEAEARYTKRSAIACALSGGGGDMQYSSDLLKMRFPDSAEREAASLRTERWARALVRSKAGWNAITLIANVLHKYGVIEWEEADVLCAAAYGREQPWLGDWAEQWPPSIEMLRAGMLPTSRRLEAAA